MQSERRGVILNFDEPVRQIVKKFGVLTEEEGQIPSISSLYGYVDQNAIEYLDATGEFKGHPLRDGKAAAKCMYELFSTPIEKYRKECNEACDQGEYGGSRLKCAWEKTKDRFEKCFKLAVPGR